MFISISLVCSKVDTAIQFFLVWYNNLHREVVYQAVMSVLTTRDPHSYSCVHSSLSHTQKHTYSLHTHILLMLEQWFLSTLIKTMINHYILARHWHCYYGDMKWSMLLCISTEKFTIAVQLWVVSRAATAQVAIKRFPLFWGFSVSSSDLCCSAQQAVL